jgi:hypothetical protein
LTLLGENPNTAMTAESWYGLPLMQSGSVGGPEEQFILKQGSEAWIVPFFTKVPPLNPFQIETTMAFQKVRLFDFRLVERKNNPKIV